MRDEHGPLMVDMTPVMRRPVARVPRLLWSWKITLGVVGGLVVAAPVYTTLFRLGVDMAAVLAMLSGGGLGGYAVTSRVEGQPPLAYLFAALRRRWRRVQIDGERVRVYAGVCPVRHVHNGSAFVLRHAAVEVDPRRVDERGAFRDSR